ncbi:hypothetical protein [Sutterella wadsworthensis]|uniref:hypothetical protein n=1 Tax=Sutterella wadsworthensis TaxID=40545 RepID=UPI003967891B
MTIWKVSAVAVLVLAVFAAGYQLASARGDAALKAYQLEAAEARAEQGRKDYARLVAAMDAVATSRSELDSARADADRMRNAFDRRLRRAEALAQEPDGADLARCTALLRESTELLSEGRELAIRSAAKADAVSTLQK